MKDGVHLPSEIDLYVTKANTGREQDWNDRLFLESLVKKRYRERLPVCGLTEAQSLLGRFLDPECLQYALDNPNAAVREMALKHLREFESEGDPYSRDILAEWRKNNLRNRQASSSAIHTTFSGMGWECRRPRAA